MLFSVIVPIYKVEQYLDECIKSVLGQTFTDFELILVDDGSPDSCPKKCDEWAKTDSRIKVIHKTNGGLVSTRKAGAQNACGDYIINVDGDDYIEKDLLETMQDIIYQYAPEAVYYGYTHFGGNKFGFRLNSAEVGLYEGEKIEFLRASYLYNPNSVGINSGSAVFNVSCKCVKRELYTKCQEQVPNDIVSGEDTVFTAYLSEKASRVYISDYKGYFYRQNQGSIEHQFTSEKINKLYRLYEVLSNALGKERQNSVDAYFFYRMWFYCCGLGICSKNYKDFLRAIKNCYKEELCKEILLRVKVYKSNFQSSIKLRLLRRKKWRTIYFLSKTYFKGKIGL